MSVGSPASKLSDVEWLQGSPVDPTIGKVTVVELWATWCPPCRRAIPHMNEIYKELSAHGVQFAGITNEQNADEIKAFIAGMDGNFSYPCGIDRSGSVGRNYPSRGIPNAFVVGTDGNIVFVGHPMDPAFLVAVKSAAGL